MGRGSACPPKPGGGGGEGLHERALAHRLSLPFLTFNFQPSTLNFHLSPNFLPVTPSVRFVRFVRPVPQITPDQPSPPGKENPATRGEAVPSDVGLVPRPRAGR